MKLFILDSQDDYSYYEVEKVMDAIYCHYEYIYGNSEIIKKAFSGMNSLEEAMELFYELTSCDNQIKLIVDVDKCIYYSK